MSYYFEALLENCRHETITIPLGNASETYPVVITISRPRGCDTTKWRLAREQTRTYDANSSQPIKAIFVCDLNSNLGNRSFFVSKHPISRERERGREREIEIERVRERVRESERE